MKQFQRILIGALLLIGLFWGQSQSYDQLWKTIEKNQEAGKFKSNLPTLLKIEEKASKEGNIIELVTALRDEYAILRITKHDKKNNLTTTFFNKLKSFEPKIKSNNKWLYQVLVTKFVSDYYQSYSWKINKITAIDNQDLSTIETWSKLDFKNYLSKRHKEFNANQSELKAIQLKDYKNLFQNTENLNYFLSLKDYQANEYIKFLGKTRIFTTNEIKENKKQIIEIYNHLIQSNTGNAKIYYKHALIKFENKKNKFNQLISLYRSEKADYQVEVAKDIANHLKRKEEYTKAIQWISDAESTYPISPFLINLKEIKNRITQNKLSLTFENSIQANKPIHLVAKTKNVDDFLVEVYKINENTSKIIDLINDDDAEGDFHEIKKKLVFNENYSFPHPKDYKEYSTSLSLKELPSGIYILRTSTKNIKEIEYQYLKVTENRIIHYLNASKEKIFQFVNLENGDPLVNHTLTLVNNYTDKETQITTNKKGLFNIYKVINEDDDDEEDYYIIDKKTNEIFDINYYNSYNGTSNKSLKNSQIFLDRGIYRPGQKVYFKTIVTEKRSDKSNVIVNEKQTISLYNANGDKVSSQTFTTNQFGSYHGHFLLPKGKLNGQFYLKIENKNNNTHKYFKVEEYKRPKFEVVFEPIKGNYQLGKTVKIKGKAVSYSGIPLSDADVEYEIKKNNITWRYFSRYYNDYNSNSIIGKTKTNDKGEFTIEMKLEKDKEQKNIQVFNYKIEASVTDISGDTQTAEENIKVANVSHYISATTKEDFFSNEKIEIDVKTKNYNNQNVDKTYQVEVKKLNEGDRVIRSNFENYVQDFPIMSETEFISQFPHDLYKEPKKWEGKIILTKTNKKGKLNLGKLKAGEYLLHLFNVEGKDTISIKRNFTIWNPKKLEENQKTFLKIIPSKEKYKRNEKANIYVYSAIPNAKVSINYQDGFDTIKNKIIPLKNGVGTYVFNLPKNKKIKVVKIIARIIAYNDIQSETANIHIEDESKDLKIEMLSFRDKIEPASQEKWRIKISGKKKEKINAEVLANMYDFSLDQFKKNTYNWTYLNNYPNFKSYNNYFRDLNTIYLQSKYKYYDYYRIQAPYFNWKINNYTTRTIRGLKAQEGVKKPNSSPPPPPRNPGKGKAIKIRGVSSVTSVQHDDALVDIYESRTPSKEEMEIYTDNNKVFIPKPVKSPKTETPPPSIENIKVRENFNETAFFYPNLYTDKNGEVSFEFTSPEALTKWKLMLLAHNKEARVGYLEKEVVTQKKFSISPNHPRFVREGDVLNFKTKISSLVDKSLSGNAHLQIINPITNEDISSEFQFNSTKKFSLKENGNTLTEWRIKVPKNRSVMAIKVVAKAGDFSDGEQIAIPILPNRILVKEALPIFVKEGEKKTFGFENFNNSKTLESVSMSLELSTNPIWEVIFALPSLKTNPKSSADVIYNKWFADVLASEIMKNNPKIKTIFKEYQNKELLISNLEKNQELKQVLLDQTPWVLASKNETEQMEKIARLFDVNTMSNEIKSDWKELQQLQNTDGGFSWYKGYKSSYSTSMYILKSLGKLNLWLKGNTASYQNNDQKKMVRQLISYVDKKALKYWKKNDRTWSNFVLDYLDTRRYWEKDYPLNPTAKKIKKKVIAQSKKAKINEFTFFGLHRSALLFDHYGEKKTSTKLLTYLKETSTETDNQGIYWKKNRNNWGWYQSGISNHSGAIEAFQTLTPKDTNFIEEMKMWLITQKETNSWGTSKNTAEVIFTILNSGKSWTNNHNVNVVWGGETVKDNATGYLKKSISGGDIQPNKAQVSIDKQSAGVVQGGLFWTYFEELENVNSSENYVSITKELYKKVKTENGEELKKITASTPLKIGDKVTVRMILNTDRDMQYIHIKDNRAAGFEPLNGRSGYQWKNGLGYYQNVKDTSTDFFIQYLRKGKYVFEYDYRCNASGEFSNGITTLQNYYAPQMNSRSKGIKVKIED